MAAEKTAWVLAGGGSLGAVQVGMMKALVASGQRPDLLVGASVGAINCAYFSAYPDADGVERLSQIWLSLRQQDIFPLSLLGGLRALLMSRDHLIPDEALRRLIRRALPFERLEQARVPLHIMTTDLLSGAEVLLSSGPAEPALLASAAIPAVFPPVHHQGHCLVDGGVASNAPVSSAVRLGAERVIVLPTGFGCSCPAPPRGVAPLAMHALNLLTMRQLVREVEQLHPRIPVSIVPSLCPLDVSVFDFSHTADLMARSEALTAEWLAAGGLDQGGVPDALRPHHH